MENQILSIDQMQELIDMGIDTSKASHYICTYYEEVAPEILTQDAIRLLEELCDYEFECKIPVFTLQDILEMLPKCIYVADTRTDEEEYIGINYLRIGYPTMLDRLYLMYTKDMNMNSGWATFDAEESLLNAAFNMLKWCKQNKIKLKIE